MTPAINFLIKENIRHTVHPYSLVNTEGNYGQAVANALNVTHDRLFKTLLISLNSEPTKLGVCIIPVSSTLNLKKAAKSIGAKKAMMAETAIAEKTTGYVIGGISPFGQKKRLPIVIDTTACQWETIFSSGGKRGLQIEVATEDLICALNASVNDLID
jgi:Cys-tRNA(Pro)/Cys-tRNA(Cys) deacylase